MKGKKKEETPLKAIEVEAKEREEISKSYACLPITTLSYYAAAVVVGGLEANLT